MSLRLSSSGTPGSPGSSPPPVVDRVARVVAGTVARVAVVGEPDGRAGGALARGRGHRGAGERGVVLLGVARGVLRVHLDRVAVLDQLGRQAELVEEGLEPLADAVTGPHEAGPALGAGRVRLDLGVAEVELGLRDRRDRDRRLEDLDLDRRGDAGAAVAAEGAGVGRSGRAGRRDVGRRRGRRRVGAASGTPSETPSETLTATSWRRRRRRRAVRPRRPGRERQRRGRQPRRHIGMTDVCFMPPLPG